MSGKIILPGSPGFYINKKRYFEIENENVARVAGFFRGEAIKGGRVMRSFGVEVPNQNLITNAGMNVIGGSGAFSYMQLGTGTATPAVTDATLANYGVTVSTGYPTVTSGNGGSPDYYGWSLASWTSAVGGATGNWTEIGMSSSASNTSGALRSRALILDNLGSPTTFPVLADEQFRGYYEFRVYPPTADSVANILVGSTPTVVTSRPAMVGNWQAFNVFSGVASPFGAQMAMSGSLVAATAFPTTITNGIYPSLIGDSYTAGSNTRDFHFDLTPPQWATTFKGFAGAWGPYVIGFQNQYVPNITKMNVESMRFNIRFSWARR